MQSRNLINDDFLDPRKRLAKFGTPDFNRAFTKKEVVYRNYNKHNPPIGRIQRQDDVFYLDLKEACRIGIFGKTRAGKSWLLRAFADRVVKGGGVVVFPTDVKDEFKTSYKPLQKKFHRMLLPNEKAQGMKVCSLRPTYFKSLLDEDMTPEQKDKKGLSEDNYWYSPDLSKMSRADFMTLFKVKSMGAELSVVMEDLFNRMKPLLQAHNFDFDAFEGMVDELPDINEGTRKKLRLRIRALKNSGFYEQKYERSLVDLINKGFMPSMNLEHFDRFGDSGLNYNETILAMFVREIVDARRKGLIPPVWIILDELARFVNNKKENSIRHILEDSFETDTKYGVNYFFATQFMNTMPERFIENSKYIMLPGDIGLPTLKDVMRRFGLFHNQQTLNNDANRLKKRMSAKRHEWLLVDTRGPSKDIIVPIPPLSHHMETSN
jgi:hypothetical protein